MLAMSAIPRGFRMGESYPGIYLSYTELQVMLGLLRGKNRAQIAFDLSISQRSVDYYCCNMMKLMGFEALDALVNAMRCNKLFTELC